MSIFSAGISRLSFASKKDDTNRKNGIDAIAGSIPKSLEENSILKQNFLKNKLFLPYELLHFRRNTGPGNGNIDRVITDSRMFVWEINPDKAVEIEVSLRRTASLPPTVDPLILPGQKFVQLVSGIVSYNRQSV